MGASSSCIEDIISFFNTGSMLHKDIRSVFRIEFGRKLLTLQMGPTSTFKIQGSGLSAASSESSLSAPGAHLVTWGHQRWKEAAP